MDEQQDSVSFDPIADRYDATRYYPLDVAEHIAAGLMRLAGLAVGAHLLEIGIGTGRIALPLLEQGIDVTGVDISQLMVERLQEKYTAMQAAEPLRPWGALDVVMTDMSALPFSDNSFDAAVAVHVFHLVSSWRRALDEVLRVVKAGGSFLLGQDVRTLEAHNRIHDKWEEIVEQLGYIPSTVGAQGYNTVVAELRDRGVTVEENVLASWEARKAPSDALRDIVEREWSRTWRVPDDIFAESVRRLTAWAQAEYGTRLDIPQRGEYAFKVARAIVPVHP
ncbi:MAG: class I SAM-dependent methyltransferase [Ktedonobacterales bacterium]